MDVNEIRDFVNFKLNKDQTGNTLNKDEYNLCLAWANLEMFKIRYGLPEQYAPGRPIPAQGYQITQKMIDDMRYFLVSKGGKNLPLLKVDINGYAEFPKDYVHYAALRYNDTPIELVSVDVVGQYLTSSIVAPSHKFPIATLYDTYIQFYPKDLAFVQMDYIRVPTTPYWDAVIVDDSYIYKPNSSVQLEWPVDVHSDIANLVLSYAAENIRDGFATQLAQQRKIQGQ